jgi:predicted dinucleotide-binding enzyme
MRIAVLGSGVVGQVFAGKLTALGHDVKMGTRDVASLMARREPAVGTKETFAEWKARNPKVALGTFAQAAAHGEVLFNCTSGTGSLDALRAAGDANLAGKILIDLANPLDFSKGMPPTLSVVNTDSLAEQIQRAFPAVKVVKTLNTMNAHIMVDPALVAGGDHHVFVSGNDPAAKAQVTGILKDWFGWKHIIDLGDITTARGVEMVLPLWLRVWGALGGPMFNFKIAR